MTLNQYDHHQELLELPTIQIHEVTKVKPWGFFVDDRGFVHRDKVVAYFETLGKTFTDALTDYVPVGTKVQLYLDGAAGDSACGKVYYHFFGTLDEVQQTVVVEQSLREKLGAIAVFDAPIHNKEVS